MVRPIRHDLDQQLLPWTGITVGEARQRLAILHFSQEILTEKERDILYLAEGLLRLLDPESYGGKPTDE